MKKIVLTLTLTFLFAAFFSCKKEKDHSFLVQAREIVYTNPDSALVLLDSIQLAETDLNEYDYMCYIVTKVQANYKLFKDVSNDTTIFTAKRYFEQKGDMPNAALASLYAGCVNREMGKADKSIIDYLQALDFGKKTTDNDLLGLIEYNIGSAYYTQNMHDSAAIHYKKACDYYKVNQPKNDTTILHTYSVIANSYAIAQKPDSANVYYYKALKMAEDKKSDYYKATILHNMGVNYHYLEKYDTSNGYLTQALPLTTTKKDSVKAYLSLAGNYCGMNQLDSANYYIALMLEMLPAVDDDNVQNAANMAISNYYLLQNDFQKAYNYLHTANEYFSKIYEKERALSIFEMEKKYNLSQKEKALISLKMREQYFVLIITATLLILLVATIVIVMIRNSGRREKQKNDSLNKKVRNGLYLNKILHQMTLAFAAYEKEIDLLSNRFGVKEKSKGYTLIQVEQKKLRKITKDALSVMAIDFLQSQSVDPKMVALLTRTELSFVFLKECGYEYKDIGTMLNVTPQALHMRKRRLEEKLEAEGYNPTQIELLFRRIIGKTEIEE